MDVSRGRCQLTTLRTSKGWSQAKLSEVTGYNKEKGIGYSERMISHFELFDGEGKGKPMSPEAMYTFSIIFEVQMNELYKWLVNGVAE